MEKRQVPLVKAFDGSMVSAYSYQPCGSRATFDGDYSYRCENCFAVIGSIGQPRECVDEAKKYENWQAMGGKGWDYEKGAAHAM
jgi:hypothetical protein